MSNQADWFFASPSVGLTQAFETLSQLALSHSSEMIFFTDEAGRIVFASPNVERWLGYTSSDLEQIQTMDRLLGSAEVAVLPRRDSGEFKHILAQVVDKTGQPRHLSVTVQPMALPPVAHLYCCREVEPSVPATPVFPPATPALQAGNLHLEAILEGISDGIVVIGQNQQIFYVNQTMVEMAGYATVSEFLEDVKHSSWLESFEIGDEAGQPIPSHQLPWNLALQGMQAPERLIRFHHRQTGEIRCSSIKATPMPDAQGSVVVVARDVTASKQVEAALQQRAEQERLVGAIAQHIRRSLDLDSILQTTVTEVRAFLRCDRVLLYRFEPDWSGVIVVESVGDPTLSILGNIIRDPCFDEQYILKYQQGRVHANEDIHTSSLQTCHIDLLASFQVRANLVVPIIREERLWGLLIAHHCTAPRPWQPVETELLCQLATQVGIAIQQSELYQRLRRLNVNLEQQVQLRTAQLQQSLDFEARLKRITDKVRDSLDETQILQTAVRELGLGLGVECCDTGLYDLAQQTSTIQSEYTVLMKPVKGLVFPMTTSPGYSKTGRLPFQRLKCGWCNRWQTSARSPCGRRGYIGRHRHRWKS